MSNNKGFTLVEILVVLAILAMLVPIFLLVITQTVNLNNESRLRNGATLLAEDLAEKLLAQEGPPATGVQPPYAWEWTTGVAVHDELEEITIRVTWEYRSKPKEVQLITYRLKVTP